MSSSSPPLTAADPWVRIVTTVIARSLTALQRGAADDIRMSPEAAARAPPVDLVTPDAALCPGFAGRHTAADLSVDPAFYDPAAVLDSLRLVDPRDLALAILRAVSHTAALVGGTNRPPAFSPATVALLESRLRERIADYLGHRPNPLLIVPCQGVPVSRMSVTVILARDLALDALVSLRSSVEFRRLEGMHPPADLRAEDDGTWYYRCPMGFVLACIVRLIIFFLIVYCLVRLYRERRAVARACQDLLTASPVTASAPRCPPSAAFAWSEWTPAGYRVNRF